MFYYLRTYYLILSQALDVTVSVFSFLVQFLVAAAVHTVLPADVYNMYFLRIHVDICSQAIQKDSEYCFE